MTMHEYSVIIHPDETGGYWAEVPALPGCGSQGETIDETLENMKGAIADYLAVLREDGCPIPQDEPIIR
ncbi:MAG TPA: type II toxin-antitoxin system HicB family antitoxin [Dehalococcoidia bacterium]|nr:type II toxin-antitoxin system HicB family antitoxin [Dehalococcoidia bacterium]